jgi:DivIVA domain-containing protein
VTDGRVRPDRRPPTRQDGATGPVGPGGPGDPRPHPRAGILRLTPDRIRDAEFPRTPLGRRGLDEDEVRRFLQQIADEVATRDAADAAARATIDHYKHALARWQAERNDELTGPTSQPTEAIDVLTKAQREAEAYVAEAREYGQRLLDDARARAQTILDEARANTEVPTPSRALDLIRRTTPQNAPTSTASPTPIPPSPARSQLLWTRTFLASLHNVEAQLRTAREALSSEVDRLDQTTPEGAHTP